MCDFNSDSSAVRHNQCLTRFVQSCGAGSHRDKITGILPGKALCSRSTRLPLVVFLPPMKAGPPNSAHRRDRFSPKPFMGVGDLLWVRVMTAGRTRLLFRPLTNDVFKDLIHYLSSHQVAICLCFYVFWIVFVHIFVACKI